ncbi:peptidase M48 Ste24p [Leptolyngbya sp. 'hensonii']|uniref:M48 family metallopeptidase n=1 Tax=Leptolyngbya sp. 'hensonii' TaxID=1922337 RepID=UPI00094F5FC8|nr:M48 family metallopeptidase [Leptolyngbya sp. 'hensonii']OLP20249.1 peptidase M48 Ste24p [Leptolyngbya sp. 'hensonii']
MRFVWPPLHFAYRRILPIGLAVLALVSIVLFQPLQTIGASAPPKFVTEIPLPPFGPEALEQRPIPQAQASSPKMESGQSPPPTPKPDSVPPAAEAATPVPDPEQVKRFQTMLQADQLYLGGQYDAAATLYREVKAPFKSGETIKPYPPAFNDPALLPPAGKVYWREAQAGLEKNLETRILVPLKLLTEQYPQFIPGVILYTQQLQTHGQSQTALDLLERVATLYPEQADLIRARVTALGEAEQWMEASIAARQFAILYPQDPAAPELARLADQYLEQFKVATNEKLTGNVIANVLTGALGYALTGSLFGPFSALQTTILLLQGESEVGRSVSEAAKQQLDMVTDLEVVAYVRELGQKLSTLAGRNDFQYEFNVILDKRLNAFALPGGKIFINAGAIQDTGSEAEIAGLLAHEISHAVLSHGFQLVVEGTLFENVTQFIPLGGIAAQLFVLDYSRSMERQADILGTRILTATGYAADGLRNLMVTLSRNEKSFPFSWISTHPITTERVAYLEELIQRNGYNRFAYEGVARHAQIKQKVTELLAQKPQGEDRF